MAHHLLTLGHQFRPRLPEPLSGGLATFVDLLPKIRRMGPECLLRQMTRQRDQLSDCLAAAHGPYSQLLYFVFSSDCTQLCHEMSSFIAPIILQRRLWGVVKFGSNKWIKLTDIHVTINQIMKAVRYRCSGKQCSFIVKCVNALEWQELLTSESKLCHYDITPFSDLLITNDNRGMEANMTAGALWLLLFLA